MRPADDDSRRRNRLNVRALLWLIWLAVTVWLTGPGWVWQVNYFHSPGPQFYQLLVTLLTVSPVALWIYQRVRRNEFWRWEFALVTSVPLVASFAYEPRAAAVTLAVMLASFVLGRRVRNMCGLPAAGAAEDIAISTGLGLGILHCALFIMGLLGWYRAPTLLAIVAVPLAIFRREVVEFCAALGRLHQAWGATVELRGWAGALVTIFGAALVTCSVMVMLAPSLAYDVVHAHLPLVHYYASQHALRTPAFINYGYLPQSVETVMTLGYVLGGNAAAQMLPPAYFVLALLVSFRIGRICGLSRLAAVAGVLFAAAMPLLNWTGSVPKNDLALAFFVLAALHGYLRWRESGNFRWVLNGAFFLAMAAGVKHSVVFAVPPLALLYLHAAIRQPSPARAMAKLAAILLVFGTFWHVRTWMLTGNPLSPLSIRTVVTAKETAGTLWNAIVLSTRLPWEIHLHGRSYFESPLDQPMGVVLMVFAPVWALARRRVSRIEAICLLFCGLYLAGWVYWAAAFGKLRFAIAPILILTVLTGARAFDFCRIMPPFVKASILGASAYALLFGLLGVSIVEINAPQLRYFARRIDREGYLRQAMLPYRTLAFLQRAARPGDPVFSVGNCALAYAPDPSVFECIPPAGSDRDAVTAALGRRHYRFLILPVLRPDLGPAGWRVVYADESFQVLTRGPQP